MRREIARQTHGYSRIGINRYEICKMDTFTFRSRGGSFFSFFFFFYFDYFVLNLATRPSKVGWSSYSAYRVKIDKQWNI